MHQAPRRLSLGQWSKMRTSAPTCAAYAFRTLRMILTSDNVVGMSKIRRLRCVLAVATVVFAVLLADPAQGAADSPPADLAIAVTAHPAGTFAHPVTLTITVTNKGPGTLQDAIAGTRPLLDDRPPFTLRPPAGCTTDPL